MPCVYSARKIDTFSTLAGIKKITSLGKQLSGPENMTKKRPPALGDRLKIEVQRLTYAVVFRQCASDRLLLVIDNVLYTRFDLAIARIGREFQI